MNQIVTFLVAILPAILFGLTVPFVFKVYGLHFDEPITVRHIILIILMIPWLLGAALWMAWWTPVSELSGNFLGQMWVTSALALFVASTTSNFYQRGIPFLRKWIHEMTT